MVATLHQVCVFSFPAPTKHLFSFETRLNNYGLCEVSPLLIAERHLVAFPAQKVGSVQLVVSILCSEASKTSYYSILTNMNYLGFV